MLGTPLLNVLALVAFILLIVVTGGVGYLTLVAWNYRRHQEQEKYDIQQNPSKRY